MMISKQINSLVLAGVLFMVSDGVATAHQVGGHEHAPIARLPVIRRQLNNLNRLIIIALTVIGMAIDGYQHADIIFTISVVLWLFLPELNKVEAIGLDKLVRTKKIDGYGASMADHCQS